MRGVVGAQSTYDFPWRSWMTQFPTTTAINVAYRSLESDQSPCLQDFAVSAFNAW